MLTFTLERRNIVCVICFWGRSSIKNPNEDQFLGHLQNAIVVVMRTNLIVIVFLNWWVIYLLIWWISFWEKRNLWRYDDENTASWNFIQDILTMNVQNYNFNIPWSSFSSSFLIYIYIAKGRERWVMLPTWRFWQQCRVARRRITSNSKDHDRNEYSKKRIVYTYLVCAF